MSELETYHKAAFHNVQDIKKASLCSCFSYLQTFDGGEVSDWADAGQTALCPKCGIDAVVPDALPRHTLAALRRHWFGGITQRLLV